MGCCFCEVFVFRDFSVAVFRRFFAVFRVIVFFIYVKWERTSIDFSVFCKILRVCLTGFFGF